MLYKSFYIYIYIYHSRTSITQISKDNIKSSKYTNIQKYTNFVSTFFNKRQFV